MHDSLPDADAVLAQFNRLIQELLRGNMHRNTFRPWEIELLLDIETCNLRESTKRETLRRTKERYKRHMEKGARTAAQAFGISGIGESQAWRRRQCSPGRDRTLDGDALGLR
jgi:hypothetical protein